jgi:TnpA family transposase
MAHTSGHLRPPSIPCGVWEAIYILEGLLKNTSEIQPTTVHADTQGQSTQVFGLAHLLSIKLMPRIRNWKDLKFFRPSKDAKYRHIDALFSDTIDWQLIQDHWPDLLQVARSVKAGTISSAQLLRRLGSYSRRIGCTRPSASSVGWSGPCSCSST